MISEPQLRQRARRMEAHNAVVDVVREAGMITLRDLASAPSIRPYYSADHDSTYKSILRSLRAGYYPALELVEIDKVCWHPKSEGAPARLVVFWKPLLEAVRRANRG